MPGTSWNSREGGKSNFREVGGGKQENKEAKNLAVWLYETIKTGKT